MTPASWHAMYDEIVDAERRTREVVAWVEQVTHELGDYRNVPCAPEEPPAQVDHHEAIAARGDVRLAAARVADAVARAEVCRRAHEDAYDMTNALAGVDSMARRVLPTLRALAAMNTIAAARLTDALVTLEDCTPLRTIAQTVADSAGHAMRTAWQDALSAYHDTERAAYRAVVAARRYMGASAKT